MNTELASEAVEFERVVSSSLTATGGFEHVRRAERDPGHRELDRRPPRRIGPVGHRCEPGDPARGGRPRLSGRRSSGAALSGRRTRGGDRAGGHRCRRTGGCMTRPSWPTPTSTLRWTARFPRRADGPCRARPATSGRTNLGSFVCRIEMAPWESRGGRGSVAGRAPVLDPPRACCSQPRR